MLDVRCSFLRKLVLLTAILIFVQLIGGRGMDNPAPTQNMNVVGMPEGETKVLFNEQYGQAPLLKHVYHLPHGLDEERGQSLCRFVHQE